MTRLLFSFLAACLVTTAMAIAAPTDAAMQLPPQPAVHPVGIPADAMMMSPCIATMGEHWVSLKDAPLGPIYGVWNGKPVFTELMISVKQLQAGFSYANVHALPGYTIDHVPHYDLHAYYVSTAVQATICPNGLPDPAMKAMNG
jgi:hypothetical protein